MSKIVEPNFTCIPNVIFDYWMERLTPAQFKVLLAICRKTFGWHRTEDKISLNQIAEMTGVSRRRVIDYVNVLIGHGLIEKETREKENGEKLSNLYFITVHDNPDKKEGGDVTSCHEGVGTSGPQGRDMRTLTKESNINKEEYMSEMTECPKPQKSTASKKKVKFSEEAADIAEEFKASILLWKKSINKSSKVDKWAMDIERIMRIDGYTGRDIRTVIRWLSESTSQEAYFWRPNILSGEKLRSQFDRLHALCHRSRDKITRDHDEDIKAIMKLHGARNER